MRPLEAKWVGERLSGIPVAEVSPILEIGSSSLEFRTTKKPHIEKYLHEPQRRRGVRIVTSDIREENGVEIVGDVFNPDVQRELKAIEARTLLVCNLLEHLTNPQEFADVCMGLIVPGGHIVVTVPYKYPYHLDPIDTMFRPDLKELHALFPGTDLVDGGVIVDGSRWQDIKSRHSNLGRSLAAVAMDIGRLITLRGGFDRSRSRASGLTYLFRSYMITVAIFRAREQEGSL